MSDSPHWWPAPAKINLFLYIVGRRPDGYHLLQTAFQFLDWCDWLRFDVDHSGQIRRKTDIPGVPAEQDLVVRAALALQTLARERDTNFVGGCSVSIRKHLPMGGGIGGGSSDAATTLVALNYLWGLNFSSETLAKIGLTLGADVPIFVHGQAAIAEGVGEIFTPIEPPQPWYVVIHPGVNVPTAEIFTAKNLTRDAPMKTISALLTQPWGNNCTKTVCEKYPEVAETLEFLADFSAAKLSGTGACCYAQVASQKEGEARILQLPEEKQTTWQSVCVKGRNRSPLLDHLERVQNSS